jgi:hypothetical protein
MATTKTRSLGRYFSMKEVLELLKEGGCTDPSTAIFEVETWEENDSYGNGYSRAETTVSWTIEE